MSSSTDLRLQKPSIENPKVAERSDMLMAGLVGGLVIPGIAWTFLWFPEVMQDMWKFNSAGNIAGGLFLTLVTLIAVIGVYSMIPFAIFGVLAGPPSRWTESLRSAFKTQTGQDNSLFSLGYQISTMGLLVFGHVLGPYSNWIEQMNPAEGMESPPFWWFAASGVPLSLGVVVICGLLVCASSQAKQLARIGVGVWSILGLLALGLGFASVTATIGRGETLEISPSTFALQKREFLYYRWCTLTTERLESPELDLLRRYDDSISLEQQTEDWLVGDMTPQHSSYWMKVTFMEEHPRFLFQDDRFALHPDWIEWTESHSQEAEEFWPLVMEAVRAERYRDTRSVLVLGPGEAGSLEYYREILQGRKENALGRIRSELLND